MFLISPMMRLVANVLHRFNSILFTAIFTFYFYGTITIPIPIITIMISKNLSSPAWAYSFICAYQFPAHTISPSYSFFGISLYLHSGHEVLWSCIQIVNLFLNEVRVDC